MIISSDGTFREHNNLIMSERMVGEIREGYRCINCLEEVDDKPWPAKCHICGFAISDKQAQRFGMEYVGNIRLGPSTSIEDELAIAEEHLARERRELIISKPNIFVPKGL